MIETFTTTEFTAAALPTSKTTGQPLWKALGLVDGEYCYSVKIDDVSEIVVRSSIGRDGISAPTGKDSIRCFLVDNAGEPLGSKVSRWTTRLPGWGERTLENIRILWRMRKAAGNNKDGTPRPILKVKKEGPNKGRFFTKGDAGFIWLS
jgi:hypothetical protein